MIQQDYKNNVKETSGEVQTTGFNIEVNESMFQMLTSNVYNDTILAVMREWSTNACDACIAAGKDVDFFVHLPTTEKPTFYVRDYGTGLPPEDIVGLFSNLGASTKRNSNAYNGTLGIGRMAGLAVSNAFTVESYYNGTHYSYAISMQNGVPVTMKLNDKPTDEPNGLKLSVSVDYQDTQEYVKRAPELYKYFDVKPKTNIEVDMELDISEHIADDWFIAKNVSYNYTNYVVMSQVRYVIPTDSRIEDHGFSSLVMKVPPGSVTFNPGRESLSLNKETVEYINNSFTKVKEEYVHAAIMAMADCKNDLELINVVTNLKLKAPYSLRKDIDPEPFASDTYKLLFSSSRSWQPNSPKTYEELSNTKEFYDHSDNLLQFLHKGSHYKNSVVVDSSAAIEARTFFTACHIIVDVKTNFKSVLREAYLSKNLVTWQRKKGQDLDKAVAKAKEYLTELGIPFLLFSDVKKDYPEEEVKRLERVGFYASDVSKYGAVRKSVEFNLEKNKDNTYLYLKLKGSNTDINSEKYKESDLFGAYMLLSEVTEVPRIKGVAKKYQSFVDDLDNWIDFEEYIEKTMKDFTFKVPLPVEIPNPIYPIITLSNYTEFPKLIQEYFIELRNYRQFNSDDNFVACPIDLRLIEMFSANTISYTPEKEIDMEELETMFPTSLPYIANTEYVDTTGIKPELIVELARLEEYYALHKTRG